jgi:hypothetical protein
MQEFTSVSVSSYEAEALTALLNEKSRDGWDVVAIVPTGSTVTGYLSRESTGEAAPEATESESSSSSIPEPSITGALLADTTVVEEPRFESVDEIADTAADTTAADTTAADTAADTTAADTTADASVATEDFPKLPDSGQSTSPVDEPAGWASGVGTAGVASEAAGVSEPAESAEPEPAAAASTAAAAPAGWYADPSSRYELRYWDGGQWTEHVSRAGQQFTDPPVA